MSNIYEVVTSNDAKDFIEKQEAPKMLGAALFPVKKQLGLKLEYIKGRNGKPVVLKASAFDTLAPLRDRIGFEKVEHDMPLFRERMLVKEWDRQQINTFLHGGLTHLADAILANVYNDQKVLVDGALATIERMRMQAISTGQIDIKAERAEYFYDFGLVPDQFEVLTGADVWSDPTSTPVQDLILWARKFKAKIAVMTSVTFSHLASHDSIRKDMNPLGADNIILSDAEVKTYLERKTGLSIALYDDSYIDEAGVEHTYYPDGKVTLLPSGALGNTVFGTTPEESDLMTGTDADVSIVHTGIAVTTIKVPHPVNVQTVVSEIVMPSFEQADKVFIATVL